MTSLDQLAGLLHERKLESAKIGLVGEDSIPHWIMNGLKDAFPQVNWVSSHRRIFAGEGRQEREGSRKNERSCQDGSGGNKSF